MITDRDTLIIKHCEQYGFITIRQMVAMTYRHLAFGYDYARKRIRKLVENGYLYKHKNYTTNEYFYTIENKPVKMSLHRRLVYDFYAEVYGMGANIEIFKVEPIWQEESKISSDGFIVFTLDDTRYYILIEINTSNNNVNNTVNKYEKFFQANIIQPYCNGYIPKIALVNKFNSNLQYNKELLEVKQISIDLSDISKILV